MKDEAPKIKFEPHAGTNEVSIAFGHLDAAVVLKADHVFETDDATVIQALDEHPLVKRSTDEPKKSAPAKGD